MTTASAFARLATGPRDAALDGVLRRSLLDEGLPTIQIDDNTGHLLQLLTTLLSPSLVVEIGTLFAYSTIYLARGLPPGGRVLSFETDARHAALARRNLAAAGVADRAEVVVADAVEHLRTMSAGGVDMVFVDGAKSAYPDYLAAAFPVLRTGGLLVADDVGGDGDFDAESSTGGDGEAAGILRYATAVGRSPRLRSTWARTGNGLLVSRKE